MRYTGIYAITDDQLLPPARLHTAVEAALMAGISMLQYRSKSGTDDERRRVAARLQSVCEAHQIPLIINDDVKLCLAVGAAGVHLGRQDAPLALARQRLGPEAIIGITCHASLDLALAAEQGGASYVAFGRFFPSHTKPEASQAPLSLLTEARARLSLPIVAIGGINAENGAAVCNAGADMLAIVHGIFGSDDVTASVRKCLQSLNSTQSHP